MANASESSPRDATDLDESSPEWRLINDEISLLVEKLRGVYVQPCSLDVYGQWREDPSERLFSSYFFPTLPYSYGILTAGEDIDLVCVSSNSLRTFWAMVGEQLMIDDKDLPSHESKSLRIPLKSPTPSQRHRALPQKTFLKLNYVAYPREFDPQTSGSYLVPKDACESDEMLAKVYDSQSLYLDELNHFEHGHIFDEATSRAGFLSLCSWASSKGILAPDFGMTSTECLLEIWSRAVFALSPKELEKTSEPNLAFEMLQQGNDLLLYGPGSIQWIFVEKTVKQLFSQRESFEIATSSGRELARNMTPEGKAAIRRIFTAEIAQAPEPLIFDGLDQLRSQYRLFVAVRATCWVPKKRTDVLGLLPAVLLSLQAHVRKSQYRLRIWPDPFVASQRDPNFLDIRYYLGVSFDEGNSADPDEVEIPRLEEIIARFNEKLGYDKNSCYIELSVHVGLPAGNEDIYPQLVLKSDEALPSTPEPVARSLPIVPGKFQTASAAMNRLRWDPTHTPIDYEIGYVDRFEKDLIWKPLEQWEKMTEEEEFVPKHRVRQLRRKEDGFVVWDREARLDLTGGT